MPIPLLGTSPPPHARLDLSGTRTSAHDRGVDLATNFGVVYQVKKLSVQSRSDADKLYAELKLNFDTERLQDGNVILVIDDIAEDVRQYLIDMKVQSIKRDQLLTIANDFRESEDRQKSTSGNLRGVSAGLFQSEQIITRSSPRPLRMLRLLRQSAVPI